MPQSILLEYLLWPIFLDFLLMLARSGGRAGGGMEKCSAVCPVMVRESITLFFFFPCLWGKSHWKNYPSRPPATKSPLILIFISWVRCGDAEEAEKKFKTSLPLLHLKLYLQLFFYCQHIYKMPAYINMSGLNCLKNVKRKICLTLLWK